ncbi:MAG: TonB family protein [Acidobacteriales bacterium]|nr:TonB family protein [Terriglobales bacterium]
MLVIDAPPDFEVHWTPFWQQFLRNLADQFFLQEPKAPKLSSSPGRFWDDVFVFRPFPWKNMVQSAVFHIAVISFFVNTWQFWDRKSAVTLDSPFYRSSITYYKVDSFLPEVKTSAPPARRARRSKGDPELAPQRIQSLPPVADNSVQTIVNPLHPEVLRHDVPLPNLIVSAPQVDVRLAVPLDLPRELKRLEPRIQKQMPLARVDLPQTEVVAPPPKERPRLLARMEVPIPQLEPVDAPKLPTPREALPGKLDLPEPQVIPPPPATPSSMGGTGQRVAGELLALNVRPAAPEPEIKVPDGSRSGVFEASPEGRKGAAGTPEVKAEGVSGAGIAAAGGGAGQNSPGAGAGGSGAGSSRLAASTPPGITVTGGPATQPSGAVVVGQARPQTGRRSETLRQTAALNRPPPSPFDIARSESRRLPPPIEAPKPADAVFGDKRVYQMAINLPNLTSAGGSWIIRFAEKDPVQRAGELSTPVALSKVDPGYPPDLVEGRMEGVVVLYAVIRADGTVTDIRVIHGSHPKLDESAMRAFARWRFRPATKSGQPVDLEAVVQIPFRARKSGF